MSRWSPIRFAIFLQSRTLPPRWRQWAPTPFRLAAIGHALEFTTWVSLERQQNLSPEAAVDLMVRLVEAAGDDTPLPRPDA
jgi:hypothetical protein